MGVIQQTLKFGIIGLLFSWLALYFRYHDRSTLTAQEYSLPERPHLTGALEISALNGAEHLMKGKFAGPESIIVEGDSIFTGVSDGRILEIRDGKIVKEVKLTKEKNCGGFDSEPRCGRPLGIRRLDRDHLVVADAYLGIFVINWKKGTNRQLVRGDVPIDGQPIKFCNDIEVLNDDVLIFSDSSYRWARREFMRAILEHGATGRVFKHTISTGKTEVLMKDLQFPNGVQLMADKDHLLVAELGMSRILKYSLSSGHNSMFAENLPGLPDNIRMADDGTIWVGLAGVRHSKAPSFVDLVGPHPSLRQALIDLVPARVWYDYTHYVLPKHGLLVQLNPNGKIIRSVHDVNGDFFSDASQVTAVDGVLYLGSFHADSIVKIKSK